MVNANGFTQATKNFSRSSFSRFAGGVGHCRVSVVVSVGIATRRKTIWGDLCRFPAHRLPTISTDRLRAHKPHHPSSSRPGPGAGADGLVVAACHGRAKPGISQGSLVEL